jgi:hypothetical protein
MKINKKNKTNKKGGKVIGSGGFGCVFRPALQCKNGIRPFNHITKLLEKKYAEQEYHDILKFRPFLQKIPHYTNYFILEDIDICPIKELTSSDQQNIEQCKKVLNSSQSHKEKKQDDFSIDLNKLLAIQMPYGGSDIGDYINNQTHNNPIITFKNINKALIRLLTKAIVPMNQKMHIYHADIKESNILFDGKHARLIDWGLSFLYSPNNMNNNIPEEMNYKSFQYNLPFSSILLSEKFQEKKKEFLEQYPEKNPSIKDWQNFVGKYITYWNEYRGSGHTETIKDIFYILFEHLERQFPEKERKHIVQEKYTKPIIVEYLTNILLIYSNNIGEYFQNVYLKNLDIYGWIMTYLPFYQYYYSIKTPTKSEIYIMEYLRFILSRYLFQYSVLPIPVDSLVKELNTLFLDFRTTTTTTTTSQHKKRKPNNKTFKLPSSI